jgi:polyhydroxyalkanoate synthesis regulator phasin
MSSKIETFSFHEEKDRDVIVFIQEMKNRRQNASKYVADLIRKNMNKEEDIEAVIKRLINEALKDKTFDNNDSLVEKVNERIHSIFD